MHTHTHTHTHMYAHTHMAGCIEAHTNTHTSTHNPNARPPHQTHTNSHKHTQTGLTGLWVEANHSPNLAQLLKKSLPLHVFVFISIIVWRAFIGLDGDTLSPFNFF